MAINIDTTSQQYQNYLTGISNIRSYYTPKLVVFRKLPFSKKRAWLQRDPLLKELFKLGNDLTKLIDEMRGELN